VEEIYEESNEIIATFLPMVSEEEEFSSEESFVTEDGPVFMESAENEETFTTETFQEEEITEEESTMMSETFTEEKSTEMTEEEGVVEEEPTKITEASNEETKEEGVKEEKSSSNDTKKPVVQAKKLTKQKKIQQEKAIKANLVKIMDKVDKDIKDISKNLQIKNIIKLDAMVSDQASLDSYDIPFYKSKNIYLDQLQIQDMRQLYTDVSLNNYIANDPVVIMQEKLRKINIKKQQILIELEVLKNG